METHNILVTGGAGFIGTNLVNSLRIAEFPITYRARADRPKLASLRDGVKIDLFMYRRRLQWALKSGGDNVFSLHM
jgi:nucleoside-diphosphate-sugar epimerase